MVLIGAVAFLISRWRARREQQLNEAALKSQLTNGPVLPKEPQAP